MSQKSLNSTMGVMFIGFAVDAVLYGIVVFQVYRYSQGRDDSLSLKFLIAVLCLLDTLQLIFTGHALYYFLISNFSNAIALERSIWSLDLEVAATVIVTFLVRCAFAVRLWHMSSRNKYLVAAIGILSLAQLGLGIGMFGITFVIKRFDALPRYLVPLSVQFACAVLADTLTTSGLVYYLYKSKRQTQFRRTKSIINQLIMWSINTALLCGIFELLALITWVTMPRSLTFLLFHFILGKLYTNSLLATLNSRNKFSQQDLAEPTSFTTVPEMTALSFSSNENTSNIQTVSTSGGGSHSNPKNLSTDLSGAVRPLDPLESSEEGGVNIC